MANPPPDSIADDFFDQLLSMPVMPPSTNSGDSSAFTGDSSGYSSQTLFPLNLSLDQHAHADMHANSSPAPVRAPVLGQEESFQAVRLFPGFGHVQQHQVRPDPPPAQVFHGQMGHGGGAAGHQYTAPRPRVRARRGQATDPHSIAERLRREKIAERMRALQELVPNLSKTDRAAMLDEVLDYVKFLRLQVKVLSMSRLGGAGAVAQLVADIPLSSVEEGSHDVGNKQQAWEKWSTDGTERQVAKLMDEDVGAAMQFLQSKALCIMPISLATAIYQTHQSSGSPSMKPEPNTPA